MYCVIARRGDVVQNGVQVTCRGPDRAEVLQLSRAFFDDRWWRAWPSLFESPQPCRVLPEPPDGPDGFFELSDVFLVVLDLEGEPKPFLCRCTPRYLRRAGMVSFGQTALLPQGVRGRR